MHIEIFFRDGADQILGGCIRDFRNKPYPTRARIEYYNKVLTVMIDFLLICGKKYELIMRHSKILM